MVRVAAYCADIMEQFKNPGSPNVQAYRVCHDSQGRVRRESWFYRSAEAPKSAAKLVSIEILDPVASLVYNLDPQTKKAQRRTGSFAGGVSGAGGVAGGIANRGVLAGILGSSLGVTPAETSKYLGTKRINGVDADGNLRTTVFPSGHQGRAEDITITVETWYSFRINQQVRSIKTDPRNGDYEYEMTNIEIGEPDAALFRIPADYEILH